MQQLTHGGHRAPCAEDALLVEASDEPQLGLLVVDVGGLHACDLPQDHLHHHVVQGVLLRLHLGHGGPVADEGVQHLLEVHIGADVLVDAQHIVQLALVIPEEQGRRAQGRALSAEALVAGCVVKALQGPLAGHQLHGGQQILLTHGPAGDVALGDPDDEALLVMEHHLRLRAHHMGEEIAEFDQKFLPFHGTVHLSG